MTAFHVDAAVLRAYAEDRLPDVDAWSVEAHLDHCPACQSRLVLDGPTADLVTSVGATLRAHLPAQGRVRRAGRWRRIVVLVGAGPAARTAWLLSVAVTLALTVVVGLYPLLIRPWLLLLIAPVLPVLGIAASYGPHTDPLHELVAASPYGGLRILLWRTVSVLVVAVPVALGAGGVAGIGVPGMWLLLCLALTGLTLGLGSLLEPGWAALVVAGGWAALVLAPTSREWLVVPAAGPVWLAVTALAVGLFLVRMTRREAA